MTDDFFEKAFQSRAPAKTGEAVVLPPQPFDPVNHLSRVLYVDFHSQSDATTKLMQRFFEFSRKRGERNSALIKVFRALLYLDIEDNCNRIPDETTDEEMPDRMANCILCHAAGLRGVQGISLRERLAYVASKMPQLNSEQFRQAVSTQDEQFILTTAYRGDSIYGDSLGAVLRERDKTRLALRDVGLPEPVTELARELTNYYPLTREREVLEPAVTKSDLTYIISTILAGQVISTPELKEGLDVVVRSEIPARIKFLAAMLYLSHDNILQLQTFLPSITERGYKNAKP